MKTIFYFRRFLARHFVFIFFLLEACSGSVPSARDVMVQVEPALSMTPTANTNSIVNDYLPCVPYQKIASTKFLDVVAKSPSQARALVEIVYQYSVSSIDIKNELDAGHRALHYGRVSCSQLASKDWLSAHYFEKDSEFVVDGIFDFEKLGDRWQLR